MSEDAIDQMIHEGLFDEAVAARAERLATTSREEYRSTPVIAVRAEDAPRPSRRGWPTRSGRRSTASPRRRPEFTKLTSSLAKMKHGGSFMGFQIQVTARVRVYTINPHQSTKKVHNTKYLHALLLLETRWVLKTK